jgi:hypothetical protein
MFKASMSLLANHWRTASLEGVVFFVGLFSAAIVLRYRLTFLMRFPLWFMAKVMKLMAGRPSYPFIASFIFLFNSISIFCYMMSGALLPMLPTAICFLTGMNIGLAGSTASRAAPAERREQEPGSARNDDSGQTQEEEPQKAQGQPPATGASRAFLYGAILVVVAGLELPAFWFAVAMGTTMSRAWLPLAAKGLGNAIVPRLIAYGTVLVPVLAVSAAVEAVGVTLVAKAGGLQEGAGTS